MNRPCSACGTGPSIIGLVARKIIPDSGQHAVLVIRDADDLPMRLLYPEIHPRHSPDHSFHRLENEATSVCGFQSHTPSPAPSKANFQRSSLSRNCRVEIKTLSVSEIRCASEVNSRRSSLSWMCHRHNRDVFSGRFLKVSDRPCRFKTVHFRHLNVHQNKIELFMFQTLQDLFPV